MTASTSCPNCGRPLRPFVGPPDHAPWVCYSSTGGCDRAWWDRELAADAQKAWSPAEGWHAGLAPAAYAALRGDVAVEVDRAFQRGVSARPDQLPLLALAELKALAARKGLDSTFAGVVRAALAQRQKARG